MTVEEELLDYRRKELLSIMEDISEDHWCAGWMSDNEYSLWGIVFDDRPRRYGMMEVNEAQIARMKQLAEQTDTWFYFSHDADDPDLIGVSLDDFRDRLASLRSKAKGEE